MLGITTTRGIGFRGSVADEGGVGGNVTHTASDEHVEAIALDIFRREPTRRVRALAKNEFGDGVEKLP